MTGVKIIDKAPREPRRRPRLWETFGKVGIHPSDIKEGKGCYYAILQSTVVEKLLTDDVKNEFMKESYDIVTPIEFNAMRSVVVRHLDRILDEYEDQEVIDSINRHNTWAEAESIYRITQKGRLLKVRFKSTLDTLGLMTKDGR